MRKIFLGISLLFLTIIGATTVAQAQAANSLYVTAASGTYNVGDSFTVAVRVNTTDQVNAVGVRMSYNESLQFVSFDGNGSAFGVDASSSGGSGTISIDRGTITPVSGDQLVVKITFKAIAAGSGSLQMLANSEALSAASNQDVLSSRNGGTYTVVAPTTSSPAPTTPPASTPSNNGTKTTTPKANNARTTIAPQGNATPAPLPGDSMVQLSAPATVETKTDEARPVSKVEYLLNGKLVNTDTSPPYSYSIDTTNLANGTYSLTTKTFYADGEIETSVASLVVKNPFGLKQTWLQVKRYIWLIIVLLIVAGGLIYLKFFRGGTGFSFKKKDPTSSNSSGHGAIVVGGAPIQASSPASSEDKVAPEDKSNIPPASPPSNGASPGVPPASAKS